MRFVLTADIAPAAHRPGIPVAQVLREIEPVLEFASPLVNGRLTDRWTGETRATWEVFPEARQMPAPKAAVGEYQFILTVDVPNGVHRPGIPIAQAFREIEPVIETMIPLKPGYLRDRTTADVRAAWLAGPGVVTAPVISSFGPDPAPLGTSEFGFSLTGNWFPLDAELYMDGEAVNHTDVYSQWSITGGAQMRESPGVAKCMLVCSGLGYAHFDWPFDVPPTPITLTSLEPNPAPLLTDIVNCIGTGFTTASKVWINGAAVATQFISAVKITGILESGAGSPDPAHWPVVVKTPDFPDTVTIDWEFVAADAPLKR